MQHWRTKSFYLSCPWLRSADRGEHQTRQIVFPAPRYPDRTYSRTSCSARSGQKSHVGLERRVMDAGPLSPNWMAPGRVGLGEPSSSPGGRTLADRKEWPASRRQNRVRLRWMPALVLGTAAAKTW